MQVFCQKKKKKKYQIATVVSRDKDKSYGGQWHAMDKYLSGLMSTNSKEKLLKFQTKNE